MSNVRLVSSAAHGTLTLFAANSANAARVEIPVDDAQEDFELAVSAKLLGDIVARLSGPLKLASTPSQYGDGGYLSIHSATGEFHLVSVIDPETLERIDVAEVGRSPFRLPANVLASGIGSCQFAASTDETKSILTGLNLIVEGDACEFQATDGHRLVLAKLPLAKDDARTEEVGMVLPVKCAAQLTRMLATMGDRSVEISFGEEQVGIELDGAIVTSRVFKGDAYPKVRQLFPANFDWEITMEREPLIAALRRIEAIADRGSATPAYLAFNSESPHATLTADGQDVASGSETIAVEIQAAPTGGSIEMGFNVKYLAEALKSMQATFACMKANGTTAPIVIEPVGPAFQRHLIMPVTKR